MYDFSRESIFIVSNTWINNLRGRFLVFDGPDGSGKSSQFRRFSNLAQQNGLTVCEVREPGGTSIGEQIRAVLLDPANNDMDLRTEMLLYMASRAQLVTDRIRPALANGDLVLADRFVSSTLAYQGTAGGIDLHHIRITAEIACGEIKPDYVVVFDVDEKTAANRLNPLLDRMEAMGAAYHRCVRQGYLDQARSEPDRYIVIDSTNDEQTVFSDLLETIRVKITDY